tara:strand:+ start:4402 stop:4824 length:423 start_codon:yes stop_codon:yes gene_type:complete
MKKNQSYTVKQMEEIIDFIESPKHAEDSESKGYLSDGEVLDIVTNKLKHWVDEAKKEGYSTFVDLNSLSIETRDLRNILEQRGYYAGNMWCIEDVQMNWDCTQQEAREVLDKVFSSEYLSMRIFEMIDEVAYNMGIKIIE